RPLRIGVVREEANEHKLVPAIVLHPEYNAFVLVRGAMKTLLAALKTLQFALVDQTPMGIRKRVYEEARHQLIAIGPGRDGTQTVGNWVLQKIGDEARVGEGLANVGAAADMN